MYSAHRAATTQWHRGHYSRTTDTYRPQGQRLTAEQTTKQQLVVPEPVLAPSQRTDYSARATDRTASTTSRQRTLSLDCTECSTQNTDYSHIPRRDSNDLDSPSNRSRKQAPGADTPSPTHTVYSTQRQEPRPTHATTQWHTDHCPGMSDTTGPHGHRATGGQTAQRRLDPEPDHTPIQTTGQCPHHSGAQYPTVHGRGVRGTHATRLDQVQTEILEGHTGPPDTTPCTAWDSVLPEGDIRGLATTVPVPVVDGSKSDHPFGDDYDPAITNVILAYHSCSTKHPLRHPA